VHRKAAFLVSASYAGRSPLGYASSSTGIPIKRLLPIAAVPAAIAGVAAAVTLGNGPSSASATADVAGHQAAAAATVPRAQASSAHPVTITRQAATGVPVVRLDAGKLAAIKPKGKHHRTLPSTYVVQSGDTLASIARRLYQSADYWPALYQANQAKITVADEIQAGLELAVPAKPAQVPSAPAAAPAAPATSTVSESSGSTAAPAQAQAQPAQAQPAQAQSASTGSTSSFQACVIARESGGNPQVMNASGHYGLYQFSASTWAAYGGNPADFGHASAAEQNQVFANAIAAGGESNWAPYDGC
jgi:LysM repeat protein